MEIEKLVDHITEVNDPFMKMAVVGVEELRKLINHEVWMRKRTIVDNDYHYDEEIICTIKNVTDKEIIVEYNHEETNILLSDVMGVEDLNINYNEKEINFKKYLNKAVKITNHYNDSIYCVIEDVEDNTITFGVMCRDNYYSSDLVYPKNLIRTIKEI